ncbi:hypothetical protein TRP8649_02254 [Pelagimonas phthalicica]|uniref:Uncharacterized protein n=1 Tax=Pelagimonas phthalicica TaxID=1037362 RepID=A0A238JBS5_9RHOB|nr:hypothetical protein CLV87_2256 [Pelagimonas phthalicica]SMX28140.1 hypothetical protein TRP8649_02254 [Pelagimonas phthalicica]
MITWNTLVCHDQKGKYPFRDKAGFLFRVAGAFTGWGLGLKLKLTIVRGHAPLATT